MLEGKGNYITSTVFKSNGFLGWMTRLNNILVSFVVFYGPVGFGDDTRLFVPFKMVLKVFKERDIVGYLFHEFFPFFQNFFLSFPSVVGSIGFSFDSIFFLGQTLCLRLLDQG